MYTSGSKEPKFSTIKPIYIPTRDWPVLGVGLFLAKGPVGIWPILCSHSFSQLVLEVGLILKTVNVSAIFWGPIENRKYTGRFLGGH